MKSSETDDDNVIGYDINFVLKKTNSVICVQLNSPLSDELIYGTHWTRYCIYMLKLYVKNYMSNFICQNESLELYVDYIKAFPLWGFYAKWPFLNVN